MTTAADAWQAGIDAVVADNSLNQNGFETATRTVLTANFSAVEADAWVTAVVAEYVRLGIASGYSNYRNSIIADSVGARALFDALSAVIDALPETLPAIDAARLVGLRGDRDNVDAAIDRLNILIAAEPGGAVGRLVKQIMRDGKDLLRQKKQLTRELINALTGDPDS